MAKAKTYEAQAVGKRKSSIARVYITKGAGKITVNHRPLENYFPRGSGQYIVTQPLKLLNVQKDYDILVNVHGGGETGQAGATRLGIARVLEKVNGEFRKDLKAAGFLRRDARKVERKKYGLRGARRSFQFSKR